MLKRKKKRTKMVARWRWRWWRIFGKFQFSNFCPFLAPFF